MLFFVILSLLTERRIKLNHAFDNMCDQLTLGAKLSQINEITSQQESYLKFFLQHYNIQWNYLMRELSISHIYINVVMRRENI